MSARDGPVIRVVGQDHSAWYAGTEWWDRRRTAAAAGWSVDRVEGLEVWSHPEEGAVLVASGAVVGRWVKARRHGQVHDRGRSPMSKAEWVKWGRAVVLGPLA